MNELTETTGITEAEWQNILYDISTERAVLLIGPEFMLVDNKPIHNHLRDELLKTNKNDIAYYYERDGLFLFKEDSSKARVIPSLNHLYDSLIPNEAILGRIAQIPFPLIISLNPDHFLDQILYYKGIHHQFQYHRANEKKEVERPTASLPLIYNLFGSITEDDSLVLDYDDVCTMLESTFKGNLPDKLLACYQKARTCIFLGFQFDRWYSQLLLKILNGKGVKGQQIALKMANNTEAEEAFIMSQFKIKFIGDQFDLLNEIYERYKSKYRLRDVHDASISPDRAEVIRQIQQGDFGRAIDLLQQKNEDNDIENDIITLQGRFTKLERERDRTDSRDYQTELNRIIALITNYAKGLR